MFKALSHCLPPGTAARSHEQLLLTHGDKTALPGPWDSHGVHTRGSAHGQGSGGVRSTAPRTTKNTSRGTTSRTTNRTALGSAPRTAPRSADVGDLPEHEVAAVQMFCTAVADSACRLMPQMGVRSLATFYSLKLLAKAPPVALQHPTLAASTQGSFLVDPPEPFSPESWYEQPILGSPHGYTHRSQSLAPSAEDGEEFDLRSVAPSRSEHGMDPRVRRGPPAPFCLSEQLGMDRGRQGSLQPSALAKQL
eukprot:gene5231-18462_t